MRFFDFVNDGDFVYGDVGNLVVFITKIQNAAFYVDHITAKGGVCAAGDVDLFTHQVFE